MKVIAITNQKGGIGKTTTATALASILEKKGFHTLLIDADPQVNSTDTYRASYEGETTLYDVLLESIPAPLSDAVQVTENGSIVPGDPLLIEADERLNGKPDGFYRLKKALKDFTGYDYIVIDTAPAMNSLLFNVLIAADEVIIPVTADRYGIQGLSHLQQTISSIQEIQNPALKIAGLLLVKFNGRTRLGRQVREALAESARSMHTVLFQSTIRESTKAKEAQTLRQLLINYAPGSTTAQDYVSFVNEYLEAYK